MTQPHATRSTTPWRRTMHPLVRRLSWLAVALLVGACSGAASSQAPQASPVPVQPSPTVAAPSTSPSAASESPSHAASASPASSAALFTSKTYGYSLTPPAGWTTIQATAKWDGQGAPFHDVPEADQFVSQGPASAWFFGAPTSKDLTARVAESVAANAAEHGDTCPPVPEFQDPIEIGGEPGVLLGFDCGILINTAITVHDGVAYVFGFRDPAVHAATSPADRATFLGLLGSVTFPES
jgi:hypothetical protein